MSWPLLLAGFVLTGMVTTVLGPILPWLSIRWTLSDSQAGAFFTAQFAAGLTAGTFSGLLVSRVGDARTLAAGYLLMSAGLLALPLAGYRTASVGTIVYGLGLGFVIPTSNLLAARSAPHRSAAAVGALNVAWGVGAAVWPLVVLLVGVRSALTALAVLAMVAALAMGAITGSRRSSGVGAALLSASGPGHRRVALFGALMVLYVGVETAFGGWLPEHVRRIGALAATARWPIAASAFWAGLTAGRALMAWRLTQHGEERVLHAGLLVAAGALAVLLSVPHPLAVTLAALSGGFGLAPVFPVTVAALSREVRATHAGPLIALGSLGGAIIPWLVGVVSDWSGSLRGGLTALLGGVVLLMLLHLARAAMTLKIDD